MPPAGTQGGNGAGSHNGGGNAALEARVQELEQRLAESEAARQRTEAQHTHNAQVNSCVCHYRLRKWWAP
jgi:hypothetical protein